MLAVISEADDVLRTIKVIENTCLDNKFITEGLDIDLRPLSLWPLATSRGWTG